MPAACGRVHHSRNGRLALSIRHNPLSDRLRRAKWRSPSGWRNGLPALRIAEMIPYTQHRLYRILKPIESQFSAVGAQACRLQEPFSCALCRLLGGFNRPPGRAVREAAPPSNSGLPEGATERSGLGTEGLSAIAFRLVKQCRWTSGEERLVLHRTRLQLASEAR